MLIELGTDRVYNLKRRTFKSVQGTVVGLLGLVGTYGISPQVKADNLSSPSAKVLDYSPRYSLDPYTQCGSEGYVDNETILVTYQDDETVTLESLGIIPGECGNPLSQEESSLIVETILPTPTPVPTPTTIVFPRYPQIPLPTPNPTIIKRPEIRGDAECARQTNSALDLLKDKLPVEYNFVLVHIGVAECVEGGGASVFALETPPRAIFPRSLREEVIVFAGALTHESCHLWDRRRFREMYPSILPIPPGYISGLKAEEGCENIGYQTQKKLGDHPENLRLFRDFVHQYYKGGVIIYDP